MMEMSMNNHATAVAILTWHVFHTHGLVHCPAPPSHLERARDTLAVFEEHEIGIGPGHQERVLGRLARMAVTAEVVFTEEQGREWATVQLRRMGARLG